MLRRLPARRCSRRPAGGSARRASLFGSLSVSPVSGSLIEMRGRRSAARDSMTTLRERPVTSSSFSIIVTPSTRSPNFTMPPTSVRIGVANASHSARSWPGFDACSPSVDLEDRAVHEAVVLALAAGVVDDDELAVAVHDHDRAVLLLRDVGARGGARCLRCAPRASSARSCRAPPRRRCGTCAS